MIGFGLDFATTVVVDAGPPPFDPDAYMAARVMSMYFVGADWSVTIPTRWLGRASAGTSGNGKQFRRDKYNPDTGQPGGADPSATTVGGKQWVLAHASGSPMVLRNAGNTSAFGWFDAQAWGPSDWTMTAAVRFDSLNRTSATNGGSIAAPSVANGTMHVGVSANGTARMWQRSAASTDQAIASPAGLIAAAEVCIIQAQYRESDGTLRFRKNKGAWHTYAGVATDRSPNGDLAALMNSFLNTTPFAGALGLFAVEQTFVTDGIDTIADACALIAGVTL